MVATSGGGFALMVEVSLAGMTKPHFYCSGPTAGPATGLPTRTEQADLEFVLHAGHGNLSRFAGDGGNVFIGRKSLFWPKNISRRFSPHRSVPGRTYRAVTPTWNH
jgi:hypothetical protein